MTGLAAAASPAWDHLFNPPIAHRGLWSPGGPPENSLAAFEAACGAGYGIELDVQLSADGEVVVFHDGHLARMTGASARLAEKTADELGRLRLKASGETVPTLKAALDLVAGRSLVLVEIKSRPGEEGPLEVQVSQILKAYEGPVAVIGFNPLSHAWFAEHDPEVLRGLNSYAYDDENAQRMPAEQRRSLQALEHVAIARPHFLALGTDMLPSEPATHRRAGGLPVIAWTVRSAEEWAALEPDCDNLIFEGFAA